MKKFYYLSTCSTCKRILSELNLPDDVPVQEIKTSLISEAELNHLKELTGSYESLVNKRAQLYKERGLKDKPLTELDFKNLILEHYTFLKRPVLVIDKHIYVGNDKKTIALAKVKLG